MKKEAIKQIGWNNTNALLVLCGVDISKLGPQPMNQQKVTYYQTQFL